MRLVMLLGFALACGSGQDDRSTEADPATTGAEELEAPMRGPQEPPVLANGVTEMSVACQRDADEVCNALDDDCDGTIDEGCGVQPGPLQITMAWNTGADLDLYVTDPNGETVSFQRREGASGSHLDHSARGSCANQAQPRVENVVFARRPPSGEYKVEVHYLFECEANAGAATATVSVSAAGELVGSYNYTLSPNEHAEVLRFSLP